MKTACGECVFYRRFMFTEYCIAEEKRAFDFRTGKDIPISDLNIFRAFPNDPVFCYTKNSGDCPDFQKIEEGET